MFFYTDSNDYPRTQAGLLARCYDEVVAEAKLQENFGHYYVITDTGEELSNGWETTGEVELEEECAFNDYEED